MSLMCTKSFMSPLWSRDGSRLTEGGQASGNLLIHPWGPDGSTNRKHEHLVSSLSEAVSLSDLPSLAVGALDDIVEALTSSSQPTGHLRSWGPGKMAVGTRGRVQLRCF